MTVHIRRAAPEDHRAIAEIATQALSLSLPADSLRLRHSLSDGVTFVATLGGAVVGFVDIFITSDQVGGARCELDLLAVSAGARGRGIGGKLVSKTVAVATEAKAREIRALARCDNLAMQLLCSSHGFRRSSASFDLYIADAKPVARGKRRHEAHLIPVKTLAYSGIWMEGPLCQDAIDDARWMATAGGLSRIGAVIAREAPAVAELLRSNGFLNVGEYDWWTFNLRSG